MRACSPAFAPLSKGWGFLCPRWRVCIARGRCAKSPPFPEKQKGWATRSRGFNEGRAEESVREILRYAQRM